MKKVRIHIWLIVFFLSISGFLLSEKDCFASSATISLIEPNEVVKKGDTFTLIVLVESADEIGNVEAFVSFDTDMVSFESGGLYTTGGKGLVMISDKNDSGSSDRKKYSIRFKAKKNGICNFEVKNDASIYDDSNSSMSVSCVNLNMDIGSEKAKEQDVIDNPEVKEEVTSQGIYPKLETLTISDGMLAPAFDPDIYEYNVVVDSTVEDIGVSAIPKNKGDEVSIVGNRELKEGENEIVIHLTSSLGRIQKYRIEVTKSSSEQNGMIIDEEEKEGMEENGIWCTKENGKISLTQSTSLTIEEVKEDDIPKNYEKTSLRINGISIPAYMKNNDLKSNIFLLYGKDREGNVGFFTYNSDTKIIQPYKETGENPNTTDNSSTTFHANMQLVVVIIILGIACMTLSVVLALQLMKKKTNINKDDDDFFSI